MARDLGDVIHYFIPEAAPPVPDAAPPTRAAERSASEVDPAASQAGTVRGFPIVTLPVEDTDVLRAAFVWNLAIEIARLGARATVIAPKGPRSGALWSAPGRGPIGAELALVDVENAAGLCRVAQRAAARADGKPGLVLACAPREWLVAEDAPPELFDWLLLLCSPDTEDLEAARRTACEWATRAPHARLGVTIHGVQRVAQAADAFDALAAASEQDLATTWTSYGLLVDDLHVYRAIVAQRPIGLAHPQSPAARALRDVARLLLEDAAESPRG